MNISESHRRYAKLEFSDSQIGFLGGITFMSLPVSPALINSVASNTLVWRLAKVRMRALTASIPQGMINIVELRLGPKVIGLLSDFFSAGVWR